MNETLSVRGQAYWSREDRAAWERPWLVAHMWRCDDDCECTHPRIVRLTPNRRGSGYPWIHTAVLWDGTFHSEAEPDELAAQRDELTEAAKRFKIQLDEDLYGVREDAPPSVQAGALKG